MEHFITAKTSHPGRMASNTVLSFLPTGAALLVMAWSTRPKQRPLFLGLLGSIIVALRSVAFSGYPERNRDCVCLQARITFCIDAAALRTQIEGGTNLGSTLSARRPAWSCKM